MDYFSKETKPKNTTKKKQSTTTTTNNKFLDKLFPFMKAQNI